MIHVAYPGIAKEHVFVLHVPVVILERHSERCDQVRVKSPVAALQAGGSCNQQQAPPTMGREPLQRLHIACTSLGKASSISISRADDAKIFRGVIGSTELVGGVCVHTVQQELLLGVSLQVCSILT